MLNKPIIIVFIALFAVVAGREDVQGETIAVLPFADITRGMNAVAPEFTKEMAQALVTLGHQAVPQAEVLRFMVKNRIRFSGYLDPLNARKIGQELGCALVMVGTITEKAQGDNPRLGVTLSLIDVNSGTPVWGKTEALSQSECVTALGIGRPEGIGDLKVALIESLFSNLNSSIASTPPKEAPPYEIVSMQVSPSHLPGGAEAECLLNIRFLDVPPARIALDTGNGITVLTKDARSDTYRGRWTTPPSGGLYPVSLVLEWGYHRFIERLPDVTYYTVVNDPPQVMLALKKGVSIGDITAFREHLLILPRLAEFKPVSRWSLQIRDEKGFPIVEEAYEGRLPARLVWSGKNSSRQKVEDGVYDLSFQVWDAAGNKGEVNRKIALQASAQTVSVTAVHQDGKEFLQIAAKGKKVVPTSSWAVVIKNRKGEPVLKRTGESLPALIELPVLAGDPFVVCDVTVEDPLGNRSCLLAQQVQTVEEADVLVKADATSLWKEDF